MTVKRLALFAGDKWGSTAWMGSHYRGTFDTIDEALETLPAPHEVEPGWGGAYARVLDLETGETIAGRLCTWAPPGESVWVDAEGEIG